MKLLDLFCGAGGAAVGYQRAGFDEILGVDIKPQPRYPFRFVQADALAFLESSHRYIGNALAEERCRCCGKDSEDAIHFVPDAIHASPPCQGYSVANNVHKKDHPKLIPQVRDALKRSGRRWVIENVPGAPMAGVTICGLSLGLNVKRHRLFESDVMLLAYPCGNHDGDWLLVFGHTVQARGHVVRQTPAGNNTTHRIHVPTALGREAMGIDWMNCDELSEAIPPAYTEFIGRQLLAAIQP